LQVLYDDILTKAVGDLNRSTLKVDGNGKLLYSDINGWPLRFPPLKFPYRRSIYFVSKTAYKNAINSTRPHLCATKSCPTEEKWRQTCNDIKTESVDFDTSSVATA
jgi:hypothetical protein